MRLVRLSGYRETQKSVQNVDLGAAAFFFGAKSAI